MKHDLPIRLQAAWTEMTRNYCVAAAEYEIAWHTDRNEKDIEAKHDARIKALDAILLTPAECAADLRLKIELIDREDVGGGWWCAEEALALLAIDARRLLPYAREGGEQ